MVINNFNPLRVALTPDEANPPAVIDADAVFTGQIALEGFQPVARRRQQIAQRRARCRYSSLRRAVFWMSGGNFRNRSPRKMRLVSASAQLVITEQPYRMALICQCP